MTANGAVPAARRSRFASGAQVRLPLSDGDWVSVRAELTYGQQRQLISAAVPPLAATDAAGGAPAAGLRVDAARYDFERLCAYLLDWSFVDGDGDRVPVSRDSIEQLHPATATEINVALNAHVEAQDAKKAGSTGSRPAATLSSASVSAGAGAS